VYTLSRLIVAYLYGVFPYLCLFMAMPAEHRRGAGFARRVFTGVTLGTVAFSLVSFSVTASSFDLYKRLHAVMVVVGVLALLVRRWMARGTEPVSFSRFDAWAGVLMVMALAVRAFPVLEGSESLGDGDARFHNILAAKILVERALSRTWEPFAPIRVMYPQGTHVFVAFMAETSGCAVHHAFIGLLLVTAVLTVGAIYLIGLACFHSRKAALWSAATYAFLPLWGSLDYFRWGGLPNAMGMLFLCLIVWAILDNFATGGSTRRVASMLSGAAVLAIMQVHHYTLVVTGLFLVFGWIFAADRSLRGMILRSSIWAAVFCLPPILLHHLRFAAGVGRTSVMVFREPFISLATAMQQMGIGFVAVFIAALMLSRGRSWTARQLLVLSWFVSLLLSFVVLEYLYRAGVLIATLGQDYFTCFTPSRMATDLVYPISILAGLIPLSAAWKKNCGKIVFVFCLLAAATCLTVRQSQRRTGEIPFMLEIGAWARRHTPGNALLVGYLPHLEYVSWRETATPPLPASEERQDPAVTWKGNMRTFDDWLDWEARTGRPVYFLTAAPDTAPPCLRNVFAAGPITVLTTQVTKHP